MSNAKTQWETVIRDSENSDNIENGYEQKAQKIIDQTKTCNVIFSKKKAEWPLKKQATLEILNDCPSFNEERLPEFYKRMGFPLN